jgi:hypothetical protein
VTFCIKSPDCFIITSSGKGLRDEISVNVEPARGDLIAQQRLYFIWPVSATIAHQSL